MKHLRSIFLFMLLSLEQLSCNVDTGKNERGANHITIHKSISCFKLADCYNNKDEIESLTIQYGNDLTIDSILKFKSLKKLAIRNFTILNSSLFFTKLGQMPRLTQVRIEDTELDSLILVKGFDSLKSLEIFDVSYYSNSVLIRTGLPIEELYLNTKDGYPKDILKLDKIKYLAIDIVENDTLYIDYMLTDSIKKIDVPHHVSSIILKDTTNKNVIINIIGCDFLNKELDFFKNYHRFNELCDLKGKAPNFVFYSAPPNYKLDVICN